MKILFVHGETKEIAGAGMKVARNEQAGFMLS